MLGVGSVGGREGAIAGYEGVHVYFTGRDGVRGVGLEVEAREAGE